MSQTFFYDSGEEKLGPISASQLIQLHQEGTITSETWVRRGDSSTWRRFADIDLRQEQEIERKKSFWRLLWRQMTPGTIFGALCLIGFIIGIIALSLIAFKFLWLPLLIVFIVWWVMGNVR